MKKVVILILSALTIIGGAIPALASDKNENHLLISTNISKDTNNNNLIIDKKNIDMGKARVVIKNGKWE